ncbi:hypothetical protein [Saccharothrix sp. Mg75]|uniref:hypothetical protein n=1 Tax=Saccharothrix sp. Mg75 TaxID=3445357 RepID=UPI003EEDB358
MEETLIGVVGWLVAALSGLATVVVTMVAVVQQRRVQRGVLRLTVGVTCMILGLFAVAMAAVPLYTQDLSPLAGTGVKFAALAAAGVVLSIIGATVVLLAPSIDRHDMQEVLAAVELRIEQSERRDRIDRRHQVDLGVRRMDEPVGRPPRSLSVSTLVAGGVTFLCGGRGSGKTAVLRRFALDWCRRSFHRRKPRDLVVYVEVRALESITVGAIRRHLTEGFDDAVVGEKLGKYLDDRTGRHRWLFAFDIGDDLTLDQAAKYAAAVGEFLRTRHRDRAVIAMRTPPPNADVVLAVGELTALSSLRLLQRHGITISTHAALLDRLHTDPEFVELRREVALFSGLASYWATAPFRGESRKEVIDGFLASRFDLAGYLGEDLAARVAHAEEAAFRLIVDPNAAVGANSVAAVVVADLGRFEGTTFRFRSPLTQAHLAARYVLRQNPEIDVDALLDDADGRAMLVAALRSPDGAVRDELITRLARRVQDHQLDTARADGLVPGEVVPLNRTP